MSWPAYDWSRATDCDLSAVISRQDVPLLTRLGLAYKSRLEGKALVPLVYLKDHCWLSQFLRVPHLNFPSISHTINLLIPEMATTISQTGLPAETNPPITTLHDQSASPTTLDVEKQRTDEPKEATAKQSAFKSLGWLDRFLAVWIFLAMAIGIILGNFVENTGPALQKGKFVGVSIPIGMYLRTPKNIALV